MRSEDPSFSAALLATHFLFLVIEAGEARKSVIGLDLTKLFGFDLSKNRQTITLPTLHIK
jgi:hypothetical protein